MPKAYQCAVCVRSHLKRRRPIKVKLLQKYVSKLINREIQEDDVICDKCRVLYKINVINLSQEQKGASQHNDETDIIVLDGTYIYIQKSADYAFQRMQIIVTRTLINICVCACMHYNVL